ncbi:MAG: hypothetical protein QOD39_1793 [Mycobacterium sp.]|jgi:hypothetical protein|nr:hypothetical protein [Mycobacterium sp.]
MGDRFCGGIVRQHPDLNSLSANPDRQRVVALTLLSVDGVLSAIAGSFFLQIHIGSMPFPISALISGLVNAALVWAALQWTSGPALAGLPLWTWLVTVAVFTLPGPGDGIVFGGSGIVEYAPLLLIVLGTLPPAVVLRRHFSA